MQKEPERRQRLNENAEAVHLLLKDMCDKLDKSFADSLWLMAGTLNSKLIGEDGKGLRESPASGGNPVVIQLVRSVVV